MNQQQLASANLDNLTQLYKAMGAQTVATTDGDTYLCKQWPFRAWRACDLTADADPATVLSREALAAMPSATKVPMFGLQPRRQQALLAAGFNAPVQQTAMVLPLAKVSFDGNRSGDAELSIAAVTDIDVRRSWVATCSAAFGYDMDFEVIERVSQDPRCQISLATINGQAAGTVLTLTTEFNGKTIRGVHQLGVSPNFRRRGLAKQLMEYVIAAAQADNIDIISLQASTAAKGLYLQLGFNELFVISNFQR